ncbi:MAG: class I tRNA ligase family protein, partial [Fimbriiglobus sp.]
DGYIYRGKRLVNWDVQLQTSVADDETYTEDTKGGFWTFKYPVNGEPGASAPGDSQQYIRFSTTRPETMLGDTAVCVHPDDERYKALVGKTVTIPLNGRRIPIIADGQLADPSLGTGCVKVTPAHDPNDYACYARKLGHSDEIGIINILNPDGTINAEGSKYAGMDRMKVRDAVVKEMEELGYFEGKEDRVIPLKYSDRSKSPIEPYLSDQWFVNMGDRDGKPGLAQTAMDAVTSGRVKFFPERYKDTYLSWLGEKRDWCVSRQLWWGHRIPVWTRPKWDGESYTQKAVLAYMHKYVVLPAFDGDEERSRRAMDDIHCTYTDDHLHLCIRTPEVEAAIGETLGIMGYTQDPDVLDTWFSSALWPHSTLGWPEPTPELKHFYPT